MKTLKVILSGLLISALLIAAISSSTKSSLADEIDLKLNLLVQEIDSGASRSSDPMVNMSSNPYDYIRDNQNYSEIVNVGYDALPILENSLDGTGDSGLREYIICIAIEEIAKCDLKQFEEFKWESANGFKKNWRPYLSKVPIIVKDILSSNKSSNDKEKEIIRLGMPAVPYVIQHAKSIDNEANSQTAATLSMLLNVEDKNSNTISEFENSNQAKIIKLKNYVENR